MVSQLKLTVICENSVFGPSGLIGEHGWSCYFETEGYSMLFDTGQGLGVLDYQYSEVYTEESPQSANPYCDGWYSSGSCRSCPVWSHSIGP